MERQSKGSRGLEAYCKGGQGPPRAVAPPKKKKKKNKLERNLKANQNGIILCIINKTFEAVDESVVLNCSLDVTLK